MNPRSLRFRLLAWFGLLLVLVVIAFGLYTYSRLEAFVVEVQRAAVAHRAEQIAAMLAEVTVAGEAGAGASIEARFAPELNDKFVRVTRQDGGPVFVSGPPNDRSFDPVAVPLGRGNGTTRVSTAEGADLLLEARTVRGAEAAYLVEVGVSLGGSYRLMHALALTLLAGLPVVLCLAMAGGYVLIGRALRPVQQMMNGAQDITLHHPGRRLPVPRGGDEIASLAVALNQMVARLEEAYQNSSRFTADASHELRTPLTIVRGAWRRMRSRACWRRSSGWSASWRGCLHSPAWMRGRLRASGSASIWPLWPKPRPSRCASWRRKSGSSSAAKSAAA